MTRTGLLTGIATVALLGAVAAADAAERLAALAADPGRVSVSGLSSGGFMAVQYHVAFSAGTFGVGVVAGGPYNCVHVNFGGIATCMRGSPNGPASHAAALGFDSLGLIDPVANLTRSRIYLFSGTHDQTVSQAAVMAVHDFYRAADVPESHIRFDRTLPAGHAFVSPDFGNPCATSDPPFVNECPGKSGQPYDQAGEILAHLYGTLKPKSTRPPPPAAFDQTEFASAASGMASTGYVFVPRACQTRHGRDCAVHVVFHGCRQGADAVGDDVTVKVGFNAWADSNDIIVLYPQVRPTGVPFNPKGCWDWWGYSGWTFQTQSAPQLSAVHAMVKRLTTAPANPPDTPKP